MTILSLGAGVQSTTLALMGERGMIDKPHAAIFADTGDEPPAVYDHLERLRGMLSFPIHIVSHGHLGEDFLNAIQGNGRASQPPFYVKAKELSEDEIREAINEVEPKFSEDEDAWNAWRLRRKMALNRDQGGMLWRQCTKDYKIEPIRRAAKKLMIEAGLNHIYQQIGISTDERIREKKSGVKYVTNTHPLLDLDWNRYKCETWLASEYGIKTGKSACFYCPYRSNAGWAAMKRDDPEQFERACDYDDKLRALKVPGGCGIKGEIYVWRGFKPLREAEFTNLPGQMDFGFEQECDGMCGN